MELLSALALIAGSSVLTAIVTAWFNRRVASAKANSIIVSTALEVVNNTVAPLNDRIEQLETEIEKQGIAIENTNAEVLKTQLAYVILESQIEKYGHEPVIRLDDLSCISVDELREIARGIKEGSDT